MTPNLARTVAGPITFALIAACGTGEDNQRLETDTFALDAGQSDMCAGAFEARARWRESSQSDRRRPKSCITRY